MSKEQVNWSPDVEILIRNYYDACKEAGHWLVKSEFEQYSLLAGKYTTYWRRIGGMKATRRLAIKRYGELKVSNEIVYAPGATYDDDELLRMYFAASEKAGHWLEIEKMNASASFPCSAAYYRRLGLIDDVRKAAFELCVEREHMSTRLPVPVTLAERKERIMLRYYECCRERGTWLSADKAVTLGIITDSHVVDTHFNGIMALRRLVTEKYGDIYANEVKET